MAMLDAVARRGGPRGRPLGGPETPVVGCLSMTRRILDISRPVAAGIPVWPGDTAYEYRRAWKIGGGCPVNVGAVTMSLHTGAHTDAPYHFSDDGAAIADVDLSKYLGPCVVVAAPAGRGGLRPS